MNKEIEKFITEELEIDKLDGMGVEDFTNLLIAKNIINSEEDTVRFIIESIYNSYQNGYDFPIKYYTDEEELDPVDEEEENLTDEYIENNLK
jgi:hypothetical protein